MKTILTNRGKEALARAIASGNKLRVTKFNVGSAANFTPAATDLDVKPQIVFSGGASLISTSIVNQDQIRYVITIPEPEGPFSVGNIMLFFYDPEENEYIPYLFGVEPVAQPKYKSDPPSVTGNRLMFGLTAKFTNVAQAFDIKVVSPTYSSIPNIRDEFDLPTASSASFQQYVLQNTTITGAPGLAARREIDNSWFMNTFFQRLDDPNFGALLGGIAGDRYLPFYGDYYAGGRYDTPNAGFDRYLDGGNNWTIPTELDLPVDGGLYTG